MTSISRTARLQTLFMVGAAIIAAIALAASALLIWAPSLLHRSTQTVGRDMRSMTIVAEVELMLHSYNRLSNVLVISPGDELEASRDMTREQIHALMRDAALYAGGKEEDRSLAQAQEALERYFAARRELDAAGLPLVDITRRIGPSLDAALIELDEVRRLNDVQVHEAHRQAKRIEVLTTVFGIAAAGLILVGLTVSLVLAKLFVLGPISTLLRALRGFRGDVQSPLPDLGTTEMNEIARAFNEMNEVIVRQRKNQLTFVASVAHDLRNPLSTIRMSIELLRRKQGPDERFDRIDRQVDHLESMIGDLLDAARIEAGELELEVQEIDLGAVVEQMAEIHRPAATRHDIRVRIENGPVMVHADPRRLEQVIRNLLTNAIKYSPEGGPIELVVSRSDGDATLEVVDAGIGIPSEQLERIFTPFHRPRESREVAAGAGLGLSVVKRIVSAHGGSIDVTSTPTAGSRFRVHLPC